MPEWLWRGRESRARRLLLAPLLAPEWAYRLGATLHRRTYDQGLRERVRLPVAVVSVGNLAVGGSGKTPLVAALARELHARGRKLAILSRGVGARRTSRVNVVSDGERVLLGAGEAGDEPVWLAAAARGVPVLAGRNRAALGLRALSLFGVDTLLLDDGFQHHRLARDVDLVCLEAGLGLGNGHALPRGPLREGLRALERADAFIWTRVNSLELPPDSKRLPRSRPQFALPIEPTRLRDLASSEPRPLEELRGKRIGILAAIARPDRLEETLSGLGAEVAARHLRGDHATWDPAVLAKLDPELVWVTTGKDAVKLPSAWAAGRDLRVLEEEVAEVPLRGLSDWVLAAIEKKEEAGA